MENESPKPTGKNEKQPAKKPKWRLFRWIAKGTGALLLLAVLAWTGAYLYATYDLNSTIEELERDGYATTMRDILPPPVPAEESTTEAYRSALNGINELMIPDILETETLSSLPLEDRAKFGAWLKEYTAEFIAIDSAGDPEMCRIKWNNYDGYTGEPEEFPSRLKAIRIVCLRAEYYCLTGNLDKAIESLSTATNLYLLFRSEPGCNIHLFRSLIKGVILDTVSRCITSSTSEKDLETWLEFVESVPPSTWIELAFRGELAFFASVILNPSRVSGYVQGEGIDPGWGIGAPLTKYDGAYGLREFRKLIEISRKPYHEGKEERLNIGEETRERFGFLYPFSGVIFSALGRTKRNEAVSQCRHEIIKAGIRAELSRLREGKYPDAIEGTDPLTGKSFDYSPTDGWIRTRDEELRDGDHTWKLRQGN